MHSCRAPRDSICNQVTRALQTAVAACQDQCWSGWHSVRSRRRCAYLGECRAYKHQRICTYQSTAESAERKWLPCTVSQCRQNDPQPDESRPCENPPACLAIFNRQLKIQSRTPPALRQYWTDRIMRVKQRVNNSSAHPLQISKGGPKQPHNVREAEKTYCQK